MSQEAQRLRQLLEDQNARLYSAARDRDALLARERAWCEIARDLAACRDVDALKKIQARAAELLGKVSK